MIRPVHLRALTIAVLLLASAGAALQAQGSQTATDFYLAYRKVFDKAKSVADIRPYHTKAMQAKMDATPKDEAAMMFDMIKELGAVTNLKVVKETKTANGATLDVEALDSEKARTTAVITLVMEGGAWKLEREQWKSGQ